MLLKLAYILFHVHFIPYSPLHHRITIGCLHFPQYSRIANILLGTLKNPSRKTFRLASTKPLPSNLLLRSSFSFLSMTRTFRSNSTSSILVTRVNFLRCSEYPSGISRAESSFCIARKLIVSFLS
ncbi:hypothetical protein TcCL_ESM05842 [Trypanosoma cruzi]|nr:hypothetical protein TcCL_ESM05842 [Trypanosoma cruzi]